MEDVRREVYSFKGKYVSQKASRTEKLKRNTVAPPTRKEKESLMKHVNCDMEDLADVTGKVRKQIIKWQGGQNDVRLRQLKEYKDYEVQINQSVHPDGTFTAAIFCSLCNKKVHLGINLNSSVKLSNWIRHIKACVQEKRQKKESQLALTKYFGSCSSSVLSPDISTPALSMQEVSTPDPDVQTSDVAAKSLPVSISSDEESDVPSAKSTTPMPESSTSYQDFRGAPPIAKK